MPRNVGLMLSPSRNLNNGTPTRAGSHPPVHKPVNRQLDFSIEKPRQSIEYSPKRVPSASLRTSKLASTTSKGKNKRPFDLSIGADDYEDENTDIPTAASTANGMNYDDDIVMDQPLEDSAFDQGMPFEDNGENQSQRYEPEVSEMVEPPIAAGAKHKRKREKAASAGSMDDSQISLSVPGSARPRGRPPKKSKTEVYQDPDAGQTKAISRAADCKRMPPPKLRDPNTKIKAPKTTREKTPSVRSASVGPRSAFFQRSETPATDNGALVTRSGRQSIKPLQSWLGEKVVMGERYSDSLPAIKEVVRVQEVMEPPRRRQQSTHRRIKRRAKTHLEDVEEEDEEDEKAEWELSPGIMVAEVMEWDSSTNKYDESMTRQEGMTY